MDEDLITVDIVQKWDIKDIVSLYKAGKWWNEVSDISLIQNLIDGSYAFAVAVNKRTGRAVGMGRVLSDGVSDAYIQDVVVLDEWRKKGIGRLIIETLLSYCLSHHVKWIALISEPGQEGFYLGLGFKEMKRYVPMKYECKI